MPLKIDREQPAMLQHRLHFFGRPSAPNSVSWQYKQQPWQIRRPADGSQAKRHSVQCAVCKQTLRYHVHSVAATRRRQATWRGFAYLGLAVLLVSVAGLCLTYDDNPGAGFVIALAGFFGGAILGWVCGLAAAEEGGVTGHSNSWPGPTKHQVALVEPPEDDQPELICSRCGHREDYPYGSHFRKSFVAREYEAAKARFEQHRCKVRPERG